MAEPTVATLKTLLAAFNAHDLDQIMSYFAEDCVLEMPRGPDPWGTRMTGKAAVREGLRSRFTGLPDVRYDDDSHLIDGDVGRVEMDPARHAGVRQPDHRARLRLLHVPRREDRRQGFVLEDRRALTGPSYRFSGL